MNIVERILSSHARPKPPRSVSPGDTLEVNVDLIIRLDYEFIFPEVIEYKVKRRAPNVKIVLVYDHYVPPPSIEVAAGHSKLVASLQALGIDEVYYGEGVAHVILRENGLIAPGKIVVASDSHTTAAGAMNSLGRGLGALDLMLVTCTGATWFQVPEVVRVELEGSLKGPRMAKDVFFQIANETGDLTGKGVEVGGSGLKSLNIDSRANISAMFTELNAGFAVFEPDEKLVEYIKHVKCDDARPVRPDYKPDDYVDMIRVELDRIEPMIAVPHGIVGNVKPVSEVEGIEVNVAFIGSCGGGTLEDLYMTARILKDRKVHKNVRLVVTPASKRIYVKAVKKGIIEVLLESGAIVTNPGCGACFGGHMGVVGPGEVVISSSTRNFRGRMGSPQALIYLASPATVAASAITGKITSPNRIVGGEWM